jgi:hypothetical protein
MSQHSRLAILGGIVTIGLITVSMMVYPQTLAGSQPSASPGLKEQAESLSAGTSTESSEAPEPMMQTNTTGGYLWSYSVKFVCGYQPPLLSGAAVGESVVKPGNYATDINIHNYNFKSTTIKKFVIVLVDPLNV